jgi:hypothetical protein
MSFRFKLSKPYFRSMLQSKIFYLFALLSLALSACSGPEGYSIGQIHWEIEFPENYRATISSSDTLQVNTVCGVEIPGEMIQLFEFQEANAKDSLPVPNACTAYIAKRDFLQNAMLADCALEIEHMYAYLFGMSNVNYEGKRRNLTIDGLEVIEIENEIYSPNGAATHGDVHYLCEVGNHVLHIQLSYRDAMEKKRMQDCIIQSKFIR